MNELRADLIRLLPLGIALVWVLLLAAAALFRGWRRRLGLRKLLVASFFFVGALVSMAVKNGAPAPRLLIPDPFGVRRDVAADDSASPLPFPTNLPPAASFRFFGFLLTGTSLVYGCDWPFGMTATNEILEVYGSNDLTNGFPDVVTRMRVDEALSNVVVEIRNERLQGSARDGRYFLQGQLVPYDPVTMDMDGDGSTDVRETGSVRFLGTGGFCTGAEVADLTASVYPHGTNASHCADFGLPADVTVCGVTYDRISVDPQGIVYLRKPSSIGPIESLSPPDDFPRLLSRYDVCAVMGYWSRLALSADEGSGVKVRSADGGYAVEFLGMKFDLASVAGLVPVGLEPLLPLAANVRVSFQVFVPGEGDEIVCRYAYSSSGPFAAQSVRLAEGVAAASGVWGPNGGTLRMGCCAQDGALPNGCVYGYVPGNGSDPEDGDTDGDGIGDGDEIAGGTDPNDPTDPAPQGPGGESVVRISGEPSFRARMRAPRLLGSGLHGDFGGDFGDEGSGGGTDGGSDDGGPGGDPSGGSDGQDEGPVGGGEASVRIVFGDPSYTLSEMYRVDIVPVAGSGHGTPPAAQSFQNGGFGVVDSHVAVLRPGWRYDVTLAHVGTDLPDGPDYDYVFAISSRARNVRIDDPDGLVGANVVPAKTTDYAAAGKVVRITVYPELGIAVDPPEVEFSLREGQAALNARRAVATMTGTGLADVDYTITASVEPGLSESGDAAWPDASSSVWTTLDPDSRTAVFTLHGEGVGSGVSGSAVFTQRKVKEGECQTCSEGTVVDSGCVFFSQRFGTSPRCPSVGPGRVVVHAENPSRRNATPAALRFDHPLMRRVVRDEPPYAVVADGLGNRVCYRDGVPSGYSRGKTGAFERVYGERVETLPDGTAVCYGDTGTVVAIRPLGGTRVAASELGVAVLRDDSGAVTNVTSVADGRMDAVATGDLSWRLTWTSPSGAVVKRFDFGGDGASLVTLHERRGEDFQFDYRWTYDADAGDWAFVRGFGTDAELHEKKSVSYDAARGVFDVVEAKTDVAGNVLSSEEAVLSGGECAVRELSRSSAGKTLSAATLDEDGFVSSSVSSLGAVTSFARDRYGRVTSERKTVADTLVEVTACEYADPVGGVVDWRPVRRAVTLGGEPRLAEEFLRGEGYEIRVRASCGATRTEADFFDAFGRTTLSVDESGRATRTDYDDLADGATVETSDDGVVADWRDLSADWRRGILSAPTFSLVDGRSTRTVRTLDSAGDAVRVERFALVDGAWRRLSWETHAYNATHRVVSSAYSDGTTDAADWICPGPVWRTGRDGVAVTNVYDGAKQLAASTRYGAFGAVRTDYFRDAEGRVVRETVSASGCETQTVSRVYDVRGRVAAETDASGATTLYAYSADDRTNAVTNADGGTRVTALRSDGSVASVTGTAVTPEYRSVRVENGLLVTEVRYGRADSPRFERAFENGFGETVREERSGHGGATLIAESEYDGFGRLVRRTATGHPETRFAYDDFGECTNTLRAAGGEWRSVSSASGNVMLDGEVYARKTSVRCCSDASVPALSTIDFDRLSGLSLSVVSDRRTVDVRGNTNRTVTAADPTRQMTVVRNFAVGVANVATNVYLDGQLVTNVSHGAVATKTVYDAYRRAVRNVDGRDNESVSEYDGKGRLSATVDADGNRTTYGYDVVGNLVAVTNALGAVTVYAYDLRGQKIHEGGSAYPVSYAYDVYGNKVSMTTYRDFAAAPSNWGCGIPSAPSGDTTRWLYDEASGCMTNKVYADGNGTKYEYDSHGRLTKRTWARGVETTYNYDDWGNLTRTDYSDATPSVVLTYDVMGRQTQAVDAAGITTFAYDSFGSLTNETVIGVAGTNTIERFYDAFGRDAGYALNGVRQSTLAYDPATGRIASMQIFSEESNHHSSTSTSHFNSFQWTYLAGSDLKSSLSYPNGLTASWTYGNRDELIEVNNASPAGTISEYAYTYDVAGRRISCSHSGSAFDASDTNAYLYNARSELTNATAAVDSAYRYAYDFDDIGNRKASAECGVQSAEYMSNELNQYTNIEYSAVSPATCHLSPTYDADGNQTLVKTATGIWQVTYNGENRPVLWSQGTNTISMTYDRMGRRVTKNDQRFVYNGYLQIANFHSSTSTSHFNYYIWDPTEPVATRPLVWNSLTVQPFNSSTFFYTHDGNKNVSEVIASDGALAAHYEYAPFGALTAQRGTSAAPNPWRFSSEYAEDDTATVYYNYRHYEPATGRWLQRDPIWEKGGKNLYEFINNATSREHDILGRLADNDKNLKPRDFTYVSDRGGWKEYDPYEFFAWLTHFLSAIRMESPSDFDPNMRLGKCECVRNLLVISHGGYKDKEDKAYVNWGNSSLWESASDHSLSSAILSVKFCSQCKIELRACYIGQHKSLKQKLEATGCEVILHSEEVNPVDGGEPEDEEDIHEKRSE